MNRIVAGLLVWHRDVAQVMEHLLQEFDVPRERAQVQVADTGMGCGTAWGRRARPALPSNTNHLHTIAYR
jgi:hypothetical protein